MNRRKTILLGLTVCLPSAFYACDKPPTLNLPCLHWNTSKPITGYQWYIDGKKSGERVEIKNSSKLFLTTATIVKQNTITWALQVAPGVNNVLDSGRFTFDPKTPPTIETPPGGDLRMNGRRSILRIEEHGADGSVLKTKELFVYSEPS